MAQIISHQGLDRRFPRATIPDIIFKRWLEHNVPTCYTALRQHPDYNQRPIVFEFWATAPLSDESMELFDKAKKSIRPSRYTINLKLGPELFGLIKQIKNPSLIYAFNKHFIKEEREPNAIPKTTDLGNFT